MSSRNRITRRSKLKNGFFSGISLVIVLAISAAAIMTVLVRQNRQVGEKIPIMSDNTHVAEGADPGPFNSNPPTSGQHYEGDLRAGFYEENSYAYPEGYLVHNLEHGYVIFWYNCSLLNAEECAALKDGIRGVMDQKGNYKLIAYPWEKSDAPLVMTSWGRLMRFETFERESALDFISRNLNRSPEPHAD